MDRRRYSRVRVRKGAKIILGTTSVLDCVVHDLSGAGARIEIEDAMTLPEAVDVTLDGGHTFRPCRLKWRTSSQTGVEFFQTGRAA